MNKLMNKDLFKILLNTLTPQTLAYLTRDLGEAQADWAYYPEDAPPEPTQQTLRQMLETLMAVGSERAAAAGLDFDQLLEQAHEEQRQEDWTSQRNQQVQQNWLSDLQ